MENVLKFKGENPGAVQYGNFINYYKFHPPDERIKMIPKDIWGLQTPCVVLDVGCNSGDLTVAVKKFMESNQITSQFLAIELDSILIQRAKELYPDDSITFKCLDIMETIQRETEISTYLKAKSIKKFNITFCFSITMWIHLNHGDDGLKNFLKYISSISEILVIEPQPWKCYKTAVKRMKQQNFKFPYFHELQIRENVEEEIKNYILTECGLLKISESDRTKWDRQLIIFKQHRHNS